MGLLQKQTETQFSILLDSAQLLGRHIPQGWRLLCSCVNSSIPTESGTEYEGFDSFRRRTSPGDVESPHERIANMLILFNHWFIFNHFEGIGAPPLGEWSLSPPANYT